MRGKGREVNKVSCSLSGWGTLASCLCQEETRDKRVPVAATGSGPLAGKLARVPRVVRMSVSAKKSPRQICHLLQEGAPLPGPENGLLSNTRKELSEETHVLTKQEISLGKGTQMESCRVREPRRTALLCGSQSRVLW